MERWGGLRRSCRRAVPPHCEDPMRSLNTVRGVGRAGYSTISRIAKSLPPGHQPSHRSSHRRTPTFGPKFWSQVLVASFGRKSGRVGDRLGHLAAVMLVMMRIALLLVALLCLWCGSCGLGFFRRFAVLGKPLHFGFEFRVPRRDLFRQLLYCPVAQQRELFDVE